MELLERERDLADLTAWFGATAAGEGCIALLRGEAGVGKTVLLQEFAKRQREITILTPSVTTWELRRYWRIRPQTNRIKSNRDIRDVALDTVA